MSKNGIKIRITRVQDGETGVNEYVGKLKEINGRLHITFTELQEDGNMVSHLLKVDAGRMEWIRSGAVKTQTTFKAGECLPFLFTTPHGDINLDLTTHEYSYTKKDTYTINVSYSLSQGDIHMSEYETEIVIFTG